MTEYNHLKIEKKWQNKWEKDGIYRAQNNSKKTKFYGLIEFPYPSGAGMHVGHIRSNTAMDIIARKKRSEGCNVLYPIGWDAFGLPTENYAIKTGKQPEKVTRENTDTFRKQLKALGFSFDWSREINTTDPEYYKWTQWIFLQFFKKGLAYKAKSEINWCLSCKIGLANEEVVDGKCERCGGEVEKREKEQWMLAITKYADRLDKDLDEVNYLEKIKIQQRNWIGRSEGSEIDFPIKDSKEKIKIFTTRADTIFGATYMVLAPEHEMVQKLKSQITNWPEVESYIKQTKKKSEIDRTNEDKEKTGIELKGVKAINPAYAKASAGKPANEKEIPIWIADYVLAHYGTGAIMAVPMHDERDREFANRYGLPIVDEPLVDAKKITEKLDGKIVTKYKLRDWVFSRQRYWGEPIPLVNCAKCGWVPVLEKDLPVLLPKVKSYTPTDNGESPLAVIKSFVNTRCPACKGPARRETDTMPNWAGSSWYYLRYVDPKNKKELAGPKELKYWLKNGVDWYNGGMEHTTLHLLYSRFWHKFLYDLKLVPTKEPYMKRTSHGMILAEGGEKMSKSKGNVINPDDIVQKFGADTLRLYEMFMGPFDQAVAWSTDGIVGPRRFLERVWRLGTAFKNEPKIKTNKNLINKEAEVIVHKTIQKVTEDIENMSFNTAVSALMILLNALEKEEVKDLKKFKTFLTLLAPFAPHISEELWYVLGEKNSIHLTKWPKVQPNKIISEKMDIVIQINGKTRSKISVVATMDEEEIKKVAQQDKKISNFVNKKEPKRIVYVKGRLINIVI